MLWREKESYGSFEEWVAFSFNKCLLPRLIIVSLGIKHLLSLLLLLYQLTVLTLKISRSQTSIKIFANRIRKVNYFMYSFNNTSQRNDIFYRRIFDNIENNSQHFLEIFPHNTIVEILILRNGLNKFGYKGKYNSMR